jgi:hypothetical protein
MTHRGVDARWHERCSAATDRSTSNVPATARSHIIDVAATTNTSMWVCCSIDSVRTLRRRRRRTRFVT